MTIEAFCPRSIPSNRLTGLISIRQSPRCHEYEEAYFVPSPNGLYKGVWGLFDRDGHALPLSITERGNKERPFSNLNFTEIHRADAKYFKGTYIYIGPIEEHFGHFIVEGMSRLWALQNTKNIQGYLCYSNIDVNQLFLFHKTKKTLLESAGVTAETLINPKQLCVFDKVIVPEAMMQARNYIFEEYAVFYRELGNKILPTKPYLKNQTKYISKTKVSSGVTNIENENEIELFLNKNGISSVYPENLSIKQQIEVFESNSHFIGPAGSAFHTMFLSSSIVNANYIVPGSAINSNYPMMDLVLGNNTRYYFSNNTNVIKSKYLSSVRIDNITELAENFLSFPRAVSP